MDFGLHLVLAIKSLMHVFKEMAKRSKRGDGGGGVGVRN